MSGYNKLAFSLVFVVCLSVPPSVLTICLCWSVWLVKWPNSVFVLHHTSSHLYISPFIHSSIQLDTIHPDLQSTYKLFDVFVYNLITKLNFLIQDYHWDQHVPMETNVRADLSVTTGEEQAWSAVSVVIIIVYRVSVCACVSFFRTWALSSVCLTGWLRETVGRADSVCMSVVHVCFRLHQHLTYCCNFSLNPTEKFVSRISSLLA